MLLWLAAAVHTLGYCPDETVLPYARADTKRYAATMSAGPKKLVVLSVALTQKERCPPPGLNFREARKIVSSNTGNQVWRYAVQHLVDSETCAIVHAMNTPRPGVHYDALILATANMLLPAELIAKNLAYEGFARHAEQYGNMTVNYNIPTAMIGIGTQAGLTNSRAHAAGVKTADGSLLANYNIHQRMLPMLVAMSARAPNGFITRGAFTSAVLERHGVKGSRPLGGPSLLLHPNPSLGAALKERYLRIGTSGQSDLSIAISLATPYASKLTSLMLGLIAKHPRSFVVMQTADDQTVIDTWARATGNSLLPHQTRYFYNVEDWRIALAGADLAFGARLHGSMMAIYAGIPTITIANDQRIAEMVTAMMIPHYNVTGLPLQDVKFDLDDPESFDIFALVRHTGLRFEAGAFDSNRAAAASGYLDVFRGIGLRISSAVRCLLPPGHVEKLTGALCEAYIAAHDDVN